MKKPTFRLSSGALCLATALSCLAAAPAFAGDIALSRFSKEAEVADFFGQTPTYAFTPKKRVVPFYYESEEKRHSYDVASSLNVPADLPGLKAPDAWSRLKTASKMPDLDNPLVARHERYYASKPDYFARTTKRGGKYLYHILNELEKRNMPAELALLPFIESSYNPHARSIAAAEGLWQFIPSTGRTYNLSQNAFKDERRGVLTSTDAALTYLQKLHDMFGDWHLALAAYNWGEGAVSRAITRAKNRGLPATFNGISRFMPNETRNYVPKFQAVKNIISNPARYGVSLPQVANEPYFVAVDKTRDIDVPVAARMAGMSVDDFMSLNAQFGPHVITGGKDAKILLPKKNAELFKENLAARGNAPLSSWSAYQVTGLTESIDDIARATGVSSSELCRVNNIPERGLLRTGAAILVPKTHASADIPADIVDNAKMTWISKQRLARSLTVPVHSTTKASDLARRYRMSLAEFKDLNGIQGDTVEKGSVVTVKLPSRKARGRISTRRNVRYAKAGGKTKGRVIRTRAGQNPSAKKKLVRSRRTRR